MNEITYAGQLEEQYFSTKLYPILGSDGKVMGIYERNTYITEEIKLQRRYASFQCFGKAA